NDELAQSLATIERENEIRVTLLNGEIEQLKEEILENTSAIKRLKRNSSHFETEVAEMEENYNLQMRENNKEVDVMKRRIIDLTNRNETVKEELKDTKELYSEEKQRTGSQGNIIAKLEEANSQLQERIVECTDRVLQQETETKNIREGITQLRLKAKTSIGNTSIRKTVKESSTESLGTQTEKANSVSNMSAQTVGITCEKQVDRMNNSTQTDQDKESTMELRLFEKLQTNLLRYVEESAEYHIPSK
ncbi:hypothetical protein HHI36_016906, partial [Cryptolaemus montrouzieri]